MPPEDLATYYSLVLEIEEINNSRNLIGRKQLVGSNWLLRQASVIISKTKFSVSQQEINCLAQTCENIKCNYYKHMKPTDVFIFRRAYELKTRRSGTVRFNGKGRRKRLSTSSSQNATTILENSNKRREFFPNGGNPRRKQALQPCLFRLRFHPRAMRACRGHIIL